MPVCSQRGPRAWQHGPGLILFFPGRLLRAAELPPVAARALVPSSLPTSVGRIRHRRCSEQAKQQRRALRVAWLAGVDDRLVRSGGHSPHERPAPQSPGSRACDGRAPLLRSSFVVGQQTARDSVAAAAVLRKARVCAAGFCLAPVGRRLSRPPGSTVGRARRRPTTTGLLLRASRLGDRRDRRRRLRRRRLAFGSTGGRRGAATLGSSGPGAHRGEPAAILEGRRPWAYRARRVPVPSTAASSAGHRKSLASSYRIHGTSAPPDRRRARWNFWKKVQKRRAACAAQLLKRPGTRRDCPPPRRGNRHCSTLRTNR